MPTNKKESLIYSGMMCLFMVYFMSVYNIMMEMGGIHAVAFKVAWEELPIALVVAFILDWFIVSGPAKGLAFKFLKPEDSTLKKIVFISTFMILGMVFFMSLFGAISQNGLTTGVFKAWAFNIPKNFIAALPLQLVIGGPILRKVFRYLFPIGTITDISTLA